MDNTTFDRKYNVNWEARKGLLIVEEGLDLVEDIYFALMLGKNLTDVFHLIHLIYPPFDPLKTVGK